MWNVDGDYLRPSDVKIVKRLTEEIVAEQGDWQVIQSPGSLKFPFYLWHTKRIIAYCLGNSTVYFSSIKAALDSIPNYPEALKDFNPDL